MKPDASYVIWLATLNKDCCQTACHPQSVHWKSTITATWIPPSGIFTLLTTIYAPLMTMSSLTICINGLSRASIGTFEGHITAYKWMPGMGYCEQISREKL